MNAIAPAYPKNHNLPPEEEELPLISVAEDPVDLALILDPVLLREQLEADFEPYIARRRELLDGVARFRAAHPAIDTEDQQAKAGDFARQLKENLKVVEEHRVTVGAVFLAATKVVNAFFNTFLKTDLDQGREAIDRLTSAYTARKVAAELKLRQERERAANLAAETARLLAEKEQTDEAADRARIAGEAAAKATKAAAAPVKDLGRTRGAMGGVVVARENWDFEVTHPEDVPARFWVIDHAKIREAVASGVRTLPGVRIFSTITSSGR